MQLQFNKKSLRCLETALKQVKDTEVTQELRLPDGMPDIGRVLNTGGQVIIRSKQWQADSIQVSGGVMMWVLYAPEDGTQPRCVDSWVPFQMNWNVEQGMREGPMRIIPTLSFTDGRSVSARKLMLRSGVSVLTQALSPMDAEVYMPVEVPEDVQLLRRTCPVMIPTEGGEKVFQIDEELTLPETGVAAQKLLSLTAFPEITEKKVMSDKVVFKGQLNVHSVCLFDDGQIRCADQSVGFSQLSDLDGEYGPQARADICMAVTGLESDMTSNGILRIKCTVVAQYLAEECHVLELVADAYSPYRDVQIMESVLRLPVGLDEKVEYVPVEQTVSGQTGRMADIQFYPEHPKCRYAGDGTDLELSGRFQLLSYDEEGTVQGGSSRWEGKSHLDTAGDCDLLVTVKPSGKFQTITTMEETGVSSQLQICVKTGKTEELPMVTGIELGEVREADPSRPSVILMKCFNEPLWNIAKQTHSTVSAIRAANALEGECAPDRMILIPVQ